MTIKRTETIIIRLTPDEKKSLLKRKTKPRLAEWLRKVGLDQKLKHQSKSIDPKLLFELNKIGININQIARYCNQTTISMDKISIALALQNIETQLNEILKRI